MTVGLRRIQLWLGHLHLHQVLTYANLIPTPLLDVVDFMEAGDSKAQLKLVDGSTE